MDTTELLQNQYNRENWKTFLQQTIGDSYITFRSEPIKEELNAVAKSLAHHITRYGTVSTSDGNELPVFEVIIKENIILERNRVGLNNLIRNNIIKKGREGALVTFAYPKGTKKKEWRFTFIAHSESVFDEESELKTNPKRYTYVFGTPEKHRTAISRFDILTTSNKAISDFINAFDVEPLSKKFFKEYRDQYSVFIEYLTGKNKEGKGLKNPSSHFTAIFSDDDVRARNFVKKMLGRIIFLYFLQRKGWMGVPLNGKWGDGKPDFIPQLFLKSGANENFYYLILEKLFFEVLNKERKNDEVEFNNEITRIPYLNGGLFEKEKYMEGKVLTFPPHLFANLFKFLEEYNFTIHEDSPEDHIVAVDPEMLGNIFENLLEDNKEKGAFYTPKEVVHYMCQESLIEYLTTQLSQEFKVYRKLGNKQVELFGNEVVTGQLEMIEEFGEQALNRKDVEIIVKEKNISNLSKEQLIRIDELLDSLKICDPAIGSGAFPMGLLLEIFTIKELVAFELNNDWDAAKAKENIIQNSIYGVDIEAGAVDIARLRFWLSLVVDVDIPKPLPNLDYKIVVGDSLLSKFEKEIVEIDWKVKSVGKGTKFAKAIKAKLKELVRKQAEYFDSKGRKESLKHDIRQLKIEILENQIQLNQTKFKEANKDNQINIFEGAKKSKKSKVVIQNFGALLAKLEKLKKRPSLPFLHFDWKLDFPEIMNDQIVNEKGFDIIIGNPPYVDIKGLPAELTRHLFSKFKTSENRINLYAVFIERGWDLTKDNTGFLTFIIPNSLLMNSSYSKLRNYLIEDIEKIIKLPDNVFENAIVETIIITVNKNTGEDISGAFYRKDDDIDFLNLEFNKFKRDVWKMDKKNRFNIFVSEGQTSILSIIEETELKVRDFFDFSLGITPYDKYKGHSQELIKSKAYHSDVKKDDTYVPLISGKNVLKYTVDLAPSAFLKYGDWLGAPRQKVFFTEPRVIVRQILSGVPPRIYAGYTEEEIYHTQIGFSIISNEEEAILIKCLCGLLNSKAVNFYHKYKYLDIEKYTFQKILIENCKNIPLPRKILDEENQKLISSFVDYLIYLKGTIFSDVKHKLIESYFEQIIDGIVYELYFTEILESHDRTIIKHLGDLPPLEDGLTIEEKETIINNVFSRLDDKTHPVRNNLFYMSNIREIALIEEK